MQKVLTTTALVALVSSNAIAAEWDVRISGYYDAFFTYAASDSDNSTVDADGFDVSSDAEIHFKPSIVLDNGLKFGVEIQLEAETSGDQIDESFIYVEGSFGRVNLGSENSAGYLLQLRAPNVLRRDMHEFPAFLPIQGSFGGVNVGDDFSRGTMGELRLENDRNNDAKRITYFTPDFYGLTLGVSYANDGNQDDFFPTDCNAAGQICQIFDIGARYEASFGDFDVALSGRWGIADGAGGGSPQVWGTGLRLGFAGFAIGGGFAEQNDAGTEDGTAFDVGVSYKTGPWMFSVTWLRGENVDDESASAALFVPAGADEKIDTIMAGAAYRLARGVQLDIFGAYVDFREDVGDAGGRGDDVNGFVLGTAIGLKF